MDIYRKIWYHNLKHPFETEIKMDIVEYTSELLKPTTDCYNCVTADVPHCYPVTETEFGEELSCTPSNWREQISFHSQAAFVAKLGDTVPGFVQVGFNELRQHNCNIGILRFFGYRPGERRVGQALLEKAEAHLQAQGHNPTKIIAFSQDYRYRFYHFGHAYLSNGLAPVQALLAFNGYARTAGEVFLAWENYDVTLTPPTQPVEITVEWIEGRGKHPNCTVRGFRDGEEVGVCESLCGGEFSSHPDAQDWLHTMWLGIEDEYQGQGIGRYLLQCALREMRDVGYRHALISTAWDNHRAFLFYSNFGYRVTDWTYEFSKSV